MGRRIIRTRLGRFFARHANLKTAMGWFWATVVVITPTWLLIRRIESTSDWKGDRWE